MDESGSRAATEDWARRLIRKYELPTPGYYAQDDVERIIDAAYAIGIKTPDCDEAVEAAARIIWNWNTTRSWDSEPETAVKLGFRVMVRAALTACRGGRAT